MIRVTEVLDYYTEPELLAWKLREGPAKCEKVSKEALQIGTVVDGYIKAKLQKEDYVLLSDNPAIFACMEAWEHFREDRPELIEAITGIQTEVQKDEVIGHPDLEITQREPRPLMSTYTALDEQPIRRWGIIDIKTSKAIQPKYWTQVAAYWWLKGQQTPQLSPFNSFIGILRLDKQTGQYEYQEITDIQVLRYEVEVFQAYLTTYQHGQKIREVMRQLREQEMLDVA